MSAPLSHKRPQAALSLLLGTVLLSLPIPAAATPIVHGPEEVLERYCFWSQGRLYFAPPTGGSWELVYDTSDPLITNPGDGMFHPMPLDQVHEALEGIAYPIQDLDFHVYVLPYPRRTQLHSAAGDGVLFLVPGVRSYAEAVVHATVTHEVGHLVHRAYLSDADRAGWESYASLRGFSGDARYSETAAHAYRPREVFAEDFRALFGTALARESSGLENTELSWPSDTPGIKEFFLSLPDREPVLAKLMAWPNPFRSQVRFTVDLPDIAGAPSQSRLQPGGESAPNSLAPAAGAWKLTIYDARGRRVRSVPVSVNGSGQASFSWDGRDAQARRVAYGTYLARLVPPGAARGEATSVKLVLLP
jgi:hypothetical protein